MALKRYAPMIAIALLAIAIAWAFAATTLAHTEHMGLPLDDSYIYLTYAKQFGRGQPFTYYPGGGYSAGSTSVLWPMMLAPFWTLGARGHALVWVSFLLSTALYAATAIGCYRFVRGVAGEIAGAAAAVLVLAIAPFAWCSLSGMEVAFAAALLVGVLLLLARAPKQGPPPRLLAVALAALSLSRPEATLIAFGICGVCAVQRARARAWIAAAWWLAPLAAPITWLVANRVLAGNFFPNTGVAKSHFYLPGFDWTYWREAVSSQTGALLKGLFWEPTSPLVFPRLVALAYIAGAVRIGMWAHREKRYLAGALAIFAPLVMMLAVIATSGQWSFQNYRYIAPALPFVMMVAAVAFAPLPRFKYGAHLPWAGAAAAAVVAYSALPGLAADMRLFAQGAMDTNTQVVRIGQYLHDHLPDASVMFHDAGGIAYYGDGKVYDMLGLVTNHQAQVANNGPGARFEFLESLPPEQRPTHFAYYPGWMGSPDFFGEALVHTNLLPQFEKRRLVGEYDMQVIAASWDHVGTGERPLNDHGGWALVDRVDIADIASERAHGWVGKMGRRRFGDPTARWSVVERETLLPGLVIDGGRTIRDGGERFTIHVDPSKPAHVVIRTGGAQAYPPFHEAITKPITLRLRAEGKQLGELVIAPPGGTFSELTFTVPAHSLHSTEVELETEATGMYRVWHWFVLQPE
jgi:hypothetical protein